MKIDPQREPLPGSLFANEEAPATGPAGLDLAGARLPALLLVAMVGALLLMPSPQGDRSSGSSGSQVLIGPSPSLSQSGPPAAVDAVSTGAETDARHRLSHDLAATATGSASNTTPLGIDDWTALLYPQLAHIAELENQPGTAAVAELSPMLVNDDPVVRLAALEALADLDREAPLHALAAALRDPDPQIRIAAIEGLSLHPDASPAAIEARVFDSQRQVRIAAIDALANLEAASSVAVLGGLLYDPDPEVRMSALAALGDIGGPRTLQYVEQLRHDPVESIRESAAAILFEAEQQSN